MLNEIITIESSDGETTKVKVVRETSKAILVAGACSEAWLPKKALNENNVIAPWVTLTIAHCFLFQAPYPNAA